MFQYTIRTSSSPEESNNIKTRRLKVENFALIATYGALHERITRWNEIKVDKSGMHEHWIDNYPWLLINNTS